MRSFALLFNSIHRNNINTRADIMRSHEARFWPGRRKLLPDHPLPSAGWRESRRPSTTGSITATRVARRRLFLRRRTPIMQPPRLKAAGFSASPDHPDPSTLAAEAYSRIALSCARVLKAPTMYHQFTTLHAMHPARFTARGVGVACLFRRQRNRAESRRIPGRTCELLPL